MGFRRVLFLGFVSFYFCVFLLGSRVFKFFVMEWSYDLDIIVFYFRCLGRVVCTFLVRFGYYFLILC